MRPVRAACGLNRRGPERRRSGRRHALHTRAAGRRRRTHRATLAHEMRRPGGSRPPSRASRVGHSRRPPRSRHRAPLGGSEQGPRGVARASPPVSARAAARGTSTACQRARVDVLGSGDVLRQGCRLGLPYHQLHESRGVKVQSPHAVPRALSEIVITGSFASIGSGNGCRGLRAGMTTPSATRRSRRVARSGIGTSLATGFPRSVTSRLSPFHTRASIALKACRNSRMPTDCTLSSRMCHIVTHLGSGGSVFGSRVGDREAAVDDDRGCR